MTLIRTPFNVRAFIALCALLCCYSSAEAQLSITAHGTPVTEDFTGYTGAGFSPTPGAGQLNSNTWAAAGMSSPSSVPFGGSSSSGDMARGSTAGGVGTGGFYGLDDGGNDRFLIQPGGSDWTPGSITLRVQNNTGSDISALDVDYDIYIINDQSRGNDFTFSWSLDDVTYTNVAALDYTSPAAADALGITGPIAISTTITGLTVSDGAFIYLRWNGDDNLGSGSRDEFILDDIVVESSGAVLPTVGFDATTSSIPEGASGTSAATVAVTMDAAPASDVTVEVTDAGTGSATNPTDFTYSTSSLSFLTTDTYPLTQNVTVTVNGDTDFEGDETVDLSLAITAGAGSANTGTTSHTLTITGDDPLPTVGFDAATSSVSEGASGSASATIALTMDFAPPANVTVEITDAGTGSATDPTDYTYTTSSLDFLTTDTYPLTQNVTVTVNGDVDFEGDETVDLSLAVTAGASNTGTTAHTLTIAGDDAPAGCADLGGDVAFINELHYDNSGGDVNEGVEIAGPAGWDLSNYIVYAYNGSTGGSYGSVSLSGTIPDQDGGYGTLWFTIPSLQNGAPDGVVLYNSSTTSVVQFLSYEGSFNATSGVASGQTSVDIGVAESGGLAGGSLQLGDGLESGTCPVDFTWQPEATATDGSPNYVGQFSSPEFITTSAVTGSPFCVGPATGTPVTVDFTSTGSFTSGNVFTAQLSDASGDFSSPLSIGTLTLDGSNPSGSISATLPAGTADGSGYRIRVVSDMPVLTGSDNGSDLEIDAYPNEVSGFVASAASSGTVNLNWTNPSNCFDEVLIIQCTTPSFSAAPSGDGSAYMAGSCGSGTSFDCGTVVYVGSGTSTSITGLVDGTAYYYKAFTRFGTTWGNGVEANTTAEDLILTPGDLMVIGVNANNGTSCGGTTGEDVISFVAFKEIKIGATFEITDNGWERINADQFGDTEGTVRLTRTTSAIAPGEVFSIAFNNSGLYEGVSVGGVADNNWTFTDLNLPTGTPTAFNFNNGGDQLFLMQGGSWDNQGSTGDHDATYDGRVIYGFNSRTTWAADGGTQQSNLHPSVTCVSQEPSGGTTDYFAYAGSFSDTSQYGWIDRLQDPANWISYTDCADYNENNVIPGSITIDNSSISATWNGSISDNWFDCLNWDNNLVPNATIDVNIPNTATNSAVIDATANFSDDFGDVASVNAITIDGGTVVIEGDRTNRLDVAGTLTLNSGSLDMNDGVANNEDGTLRIQGDWVNNVDESLFDQGEGLVVFEGGNTQNLTAADNKEIFHDLSIDKIFQIALVLNDSIEVGRSAGGDAGTLEFVCGGIIQTGSQLVYVSNGDPNTSITGFEAPNTVDGVYADDRYIYGNLTRQVDQVATYVWPIGDDPAQEKYNPLSLSRTGGSIGRVNGRFVRGTPGSISISSGLPGGTCGATPVFVEYSGMAGEGWWSFDGPAVEYNVRLHHNADNAIVSPSGDGKYRTLKAPTGIAPALPWTPYALLGDVCTVGDWFDIPGNDYTGFSDFAPGGGGSTPLPIELLEFNATDAGVAVELDWTTLTEIDNDYFAVERSLDAQDFEQIGQVEAAGNSTGRIAYRFLDVSPVQGISYYRLRQVDFDGTYSYSEVRAISRETSTGNWTVFPNPANQQVNLQFVADKAGAFRVELVDMAGRLRLVRELDLESGMHSMTLDLNQLADGIYLLRLIGDQQTRTERLIVE